jgi:hypothetical protein
LASAVDGRLHLDGVDGARLGAQQDLRERGRVGGQVERAGEVVAASGGDETEDGSGAAERAADAARYAVAAHGQHDPAALTGGAGDVLGVGETLAVLGLQLGAGRAEQPGQLEQGRRPGRAARGGVDDGGELAHRWASEAGGRVGGVSRWAAGHRG